MKGPKNIIPDSMSTEEGGSTEPVAMLWKAVFSGSS
jgi:hypothetical protein